MKLAFGCDHAGFDPPAPYYKPELVRHLEGRGITVIDCGTNGPDSVDYPDYARNVCDAILGGKAEYGVLLCGTGIGMSIAANRFPGIRAAVCTNTDAARLSKEHNDANVLCLGRRLLTLGECFAILDVWLDTTFSGAERHSRRVNKLG